MQNEKSQLDLINETRKEIRKQESKYSKEIHQEVISLVEEIITYELNDKGKINLIEILEKFGLEQTLSGINSAKKYLIYTDLEQTEPTEDSVDRFLAKYGGVIHNEGLAEIDKKIYFMMGIARNRFGNWTYRKVQSIGKNLIQYLRDKGYNDEQIVKHIDEEIIPAMNKSKNWSMWKFTLPTEVI